MIYDPARTRFQLLKSSGIDLSLSDDFETTRAKHALTGHAAFYVNEAIQCIIVGLDDAGYQLAEKARAWLRVAIDENEIHRLYIRYGTEAERSTDYAMADWLLGGSDVLRFLKEAVSLTETYYDTHRRDKIGVGMALPKFVDAAEYDRGISLFETTCALKAPKDPCKPRTEGQMSYILCLHRARGIHSATDVEAALKWFLQGHVNSWLNEGQFPTVAQWMKIAHWDGAATRESAREALLHCYDYLIPPKPTLSTSAHLFGPDRGSF